MYFLLINDIISKINYIEKTFYCIILNFLNIFVSTFFFCIYLEDNDILIHIFWPTFNSLFQSLLDHVFLFFSVVWCDDLMMIEVVSQKKWVKLSLFFLNIAPLVVFHLYYALSSKFIYFNERLVYTFLFLFLKLGFQLR